MARLEIVTGAWPLACPSIEIEAPVGLETTYSVPVVGESGPEPVFVISQIRAGKVPGEKGSVSGISAGILAAGRRGEEGNYAVSAVHDHIRSAGE
jgi:hypothetical protein